MLVSKGANIYIYLSTFEWPQCMIIVHIVRSLLIMGMRTLYVTSNFLLNVIGE